MKFKFLIPIFILFLSCFVYAQEVEIALEKGEYLQGQTVQAYVNFNKLPISKPGAGEFSLTKENKIPTGFFLKNISSTEYLVYFNIPKTIEQGNYSLNYKSRFKNGGLRELTFTKEFIISTNNTAPSFSIKPAFIVLSEASDLKITTNSYGLPLTILLNYNSEIFSATRDTLDLGENDQKSFYLSVLEFPEETTTSDLYLNEYKVPVYFLVYTEEENQTEPREPQNQTQESNQTEPEIPKQGLFLKAKIAYLNQTAPKNKDFEGTLNITNTLDISLHSLSLELTGNLEEIVELEFYNKEEIGPKEVIPLKVIINKNKSPQESLYEGAVLLNSSEGLYDYFIISLTFTEESSDEYPEEEEDAFSKTEGQETLPSDINLEKYLIREDDTEIKKQKNKTLITWIIIILAILFILFIFFMMRKKVTVNQTLGDYVSKIKK